MASFMIGRREIGTHDGWRETDRTEDRLNLVSPDGQQHATISVMQFASDLTFDEFKKLCEIRYKVERRLLIDGFIEPDEPEWFTDFNTMMGMFFSGGDKGNGRIFSGYLTAQELLTIYVDRLTPPNDHYECFTALVKRICRH